MASTLRVRVCGALLLGMAALAAPLARGADADARALLARLATGDDASREGAVEAWRALPEAERVAALRDGLRATDDAVSLAAAVLASPWSLDGEELGLQSKALGRAPLARFAPPSALSKAAPERLVVTGSADLAGIHAALAGLADPTLEGIVPSLHRCLVPAHADGLVEVLDDASPAAFRALLDDLRVVADADPRPGSRDTYVRAFRYAARRLGAEARGTKRPALSALPALPPVSDGCPAGFTELARAVFATKGDLLRTNAPPEPATAVRPRPSGALDRASAPYAFLEGWARTLTPVERDLPFLELTLESPRASPALRAFAARAVAAIPGRAAGRVLRHAISVGNDASLHAAAALAARGDGVDWARLAAGSLPAQHPEAFALARHVANPAERSYAAIRALERGETPQGLDGAAREEVLREVGASGVFVALDSAARKGVAAASVEAEAWLVVNAFPSGLAVEEAVRVARRLAERAGDVVALTDDVRRALGILEGVGPEVVAPVLRAWAARAPDVEVRRDAVHLLARLGDASLVSAMLEGETALPPERATDLARVKHPRVEAALRNLAASAEPPIELLGVEALAVFHGAPALLARYVGPLSVAEDGSFGPTWKEAKALVLAGDPIGAVLLRTEGGPDLGTQGSLPAARGFGETRDPRVRERLLAWRDERASGLYWLATACLALQGDAGAGQAWRAFLGEGRTFLYDDLQEPLLFTRGADAGFVADWVERLGTNCCLAWHASAVLRGTFPTLPFEVYAGDGGATAVAARGWFARHAAPFRRSGILDGWVPGPRP